MQCKVRADQAARVYIHAQYLHRTTLVSGIVKCRRGDNALHYCTVKSADRGEVILNIP